MRLSRPLQKAFDPLLAELRRIVDALQALSADVKKQTDTTADHYQTQDQQEKSPKKVWAEVHSPKPIKVQTQSDDTGQPRRDMVRLVIEGLALAGAVIIGIVAYQQWREMIVTADATAEAANAARRSSATASRALDVSRQQFDDTLAQMKGQTAAATSASITARESLTSVQRAFVAFAGLVTLKKVTSEGKVAELTLVLPWINGGDTQTKGALSRVNFMYLPVNPTLHQTGDLPSNFTFPDMGYVKARQFFISARGYANGTENVPLAVLEQAKKGQMRLYVWGWITYHDVFKGTPTRLSEFCDEITDIKSSTADMADPTSTVTADVSLCEEHNCSDEECRDYQKKTKGK
jgi:hypothetical protein